MNRHQLYRGRGASACSPAMNVLLCLSDSDIPETPVGVWVLIPKPNFLLIGNPVAAERVIGTEWRKPISCNTEARNSLAHRALERARDPGVRWYSLLFPPIFSSCRDLASPLLGSLPNLVSRALLRREELTAAHVSAIAPSC